MSVMRFWDTAPATKAGVSDFMKRAQLSKWH